MKKSMKTSCLSVLAAGALVLGSCTLDDLIGSGGGGSGGSLEDKVVRGLKTALQVGIDSSSAAASKVNGYLGHKAIKILLPAEAEQALEAAERIGALVSPFASELEAMQALVSLTSGIDRSSFSGNLSRADGLIRDAAGLETVGDSLVKYMNRAAELAAPRSVPIFKGAIATLTIADGLEVLNSPDSTAATAYLDGRTFDPLVIAYAPLVDSTLALVPLTRYWADFRRIYNGMLSDYRALEGFQADWNGNAIVSGLPALRVGALEPLSYPPIQTGSLGGWTTRKALAGLFHLIGEEEKEIRRDPAAYVKDLASGISDLLGEVFGEIMDMESR